MNSQELNDVCSAKHVFEYLDMPNADAFLEEAVQNSIEDSGYFNYKLLMYFYGTGSGPYCKKWLESRQWTPSFSYEGYMGGTVWVYTFHIPTICKKYGVEPKDFSVKVFK